MGFELEREDEQPIVVIAGKRPAGSFEVISDKMGAVAHRADTGRSPAASSEEPELSQK